MVIAFYIAAVVAVAATWMVITRREAVHALLYLVVSLLSVAVIFYLLGAPFMAALEVIIYAGAIMVLFIFVVMTMNLGPEAAKRENRWLGLKAWIGPALLTGILAGEMAYILTAEPGASTGLATVEPKQVALSLFGPYLIGVELASFLLLAGLVGAYHLGRRLNPNEGK